MKFEDLTEHEKRILRYLDQRGTMHREVLVVDLAQEGSRIAERECLTKGRRRFVNGSNGATPMIAYNWTKRLRAASLVVDQRDREHFHQGYSITRAGRALIRTANAAGGRTDG